MNATPEDDFIAQRRARHRAEPGPFFMDLLLELWQGRSPIETEAAWRHLVSVAPWYADDALACLEQLSLETPDRILHWITLSGVTVFLASDAATPVPVRDPEQSLGWLQATLAHLRQLRNP